MRMSFAVSFSSRDNVKQYSERYRIVMYLQEKKKKPTHSNQVWRIVGEKTPQTLIRIYIKVSGMYQTYK